MSTSSQEAEGMRLKSKALSFCALTVLLTLLAAAAVSSGRLPAVAALAVLGLLLCAEIAALLSFQAQVLKPLAAVQAAVRQMTDGHLDCLSLVCRRDEIGQLAETVNDLAVNMQEVLLYVWNHSHESHALLERIAEQAGAAPDSELSGDLQKLQEENKNLKDIVTSFSYFEIRLEHERMLAEADCTHPTA